MTDLRTAVVRLTGFLISWTSSECADLAQAPLDRAQAYLANLANQGVVIRTDRADCWMAGPSARSWRFNLQQAKNKVSYGNNAEYRRQRTILDPIKYRDWQARRQGTSEPTERQAANQANLAILTCRELQNAVGDDAEDQNMVKLPLLKPLKAAQLLNCCESTVRMLIASGQLKSHRVGNRLRITHEAIDEYLKQNENKRERLQA